MIFDVPFDTERILQHFDTAHKVKLDIFKGSSLSFQKCNPSLHGSLKIGRQDKSGRTRTYPHLSAFNFPLVAVAFVSPPFRLKEVEDRRESEVLATLGRRE